MYQVYKRKATGEPVLAVQIRSRGKIKQVSKEGFIYSEYPSQVEVRCKELLQGDYILMTDKGNKRVPSEEFEAMFSPQARQIG